MIKYLKFSFRNCSDQIFYLHYLVHVDDSYMLLQKICLVYEYDQLVILLSPIPVTQKISVPCQNQMNYLILNHTLLYAMLWEHK